MKKFLLSASILMMASASAFAATDGQTYEEMDGFTCENLWVLDRIHTEEAYMASPLNTQQSRTCCTDGKLIWVTVNGAAPDYAQSVLYAYDVKTGAQVKQLPLLKEGGEAYGGQLGANTVGFDDYGHLYVASYTNNSTGEGSMPIYIVDQETGVVTSVGDLMFLGIAGRVDYVDVMGDLTGVEARCDVMAAASKPNQQDCNVFGWVRKKGSQVWEGAFNQMPNLVIKAFNDDKATLFGDAASLTIVRSLYDPDNGVNYFYAEGKDTTASLYNITGSWVDGFKNAPETVVVANAGTNGVHEMTIGGQNFLVYSEGQYDGSHKCQAIISTADEEMAFSSLKNLWTVPADGLGQTSDGGTRIHCLTSVALPTDANGKEARLVISFKCYNGMAVYKVAQEGYVDGGSSVENNIAAAVTINTNGDVISVSEVAESIEVYNIAGQKVAEVRNASEIAAPANGVYVVKAVVAGTPVVKKVIL